MVLPPQAVVLKMRIAIDARIAHYTGAGIGQYAVHLAQALARLDQANQYVLLQSRKDGRALVDEPHVQRQSIWTPSHHRWEQELLAAEFNLRPVMRRLSLDLLHSTDFIPPLRLRNFKSVITVHDLAFLRWPHFLTEDSARYYGQVDAAVERADHIIAVSESTKNDLVKLLGAPRDKITVVYEAADP
ncbi:MAG TPA: glycosyltransferase, partial [Anaerolineae bacterium]|nr:glycosyltransferase [Anaerolineae bacterium]